MNPPHATSSDAATPHVSVNISIYNCEKYLRQTLDALLAQTYQDWECLIIDDASSDHSADIAQEYVDRDPRFKLHRLDAATKKPYPACRNLAIELSRGKWIAPLDGDDWWEPWKLQEQVALAESSPDIVLSCATGWVWCDGKVIGVTSGCKTHEVAQTLPIHTITVHPAVLMDRQAVQSVGGYDLQRTSAQDWDLFLRMMWKFGAHRINCMDKPVMYYRRHASNVTNSIIKCSTNEWSIIRQTLRRYGWGLKNPRMTWRILDYWLTKDVDTFSQAGLHGTAFKRALASILVHPIGLWRFRQLKKVWQNWRKRQPKATSSPAT